MGNKIIVEFDKERIKEWCKLQRIYPSSPCPCSVCKQTDKEQIECMLMEGSLFKALQKYIKESEVKNYKPQVIDVGLTQQELIEIDREMLYLLAKQLEDKIREIEIRIVQTTISYTIKENN